VPVSEKPLSSTAVLPLLVRVTLWAALVVERFWPANVRLVGLIPRLMFTTWPVPVSATDCGLPVALSVNTTFAVRVPFAVGLKVT
jgi:hypothetical protein